jgi:uncharacterized membrane protein
MISKPFLSYLQITILVAAEGVHKLPVINSSNDLKTALQKMGAIPSSKILVFLAFFFLLLLYHQV